MRPSRKKRMRFLVLMFKHKSVKEEESMNLLREKKEMVGGLCDGEKPKEAVELAAIEREKKTNNPYLLKGGFFKIA